MHGSNLHLSELESTLDSLGIHLKHEEFQQAVRAIDKQGELGCRWETEGVLQHCTLRSLVHSVEELCSAENIVTFLLKGRWSVYRGEGGSIWSITLPFHTCVLLDQTCLRLQGSLSSSSSDFLWLRFSPSHLALLVPSLSPS